MTTENHTRYPTEKAHDMAALVGGRAGECINELVREREELHAYLAFISAALDGVANGGLPLALGEPSDEARESRIRSEIATANQALEKLPSGILEPLQKKEAADTGTGQWAGIFDFIATASSRDTSPKVMEAIARIAKNRNHAELIWNEPSAAQRELVSAIVGDEEGIWRGDASEWRAKAGSESKAA